MSDSSGCSDEEEWHEDESIEDENQFDCLFCHMLFNRVEDTLEHCKKVHYVSFDVLNQKFTMDCYSFIKFINFVRRTNLAPDILLNTQKSLWDDEANLKPVKECDPWLMFDVEDYFGSKKANNESDMNGDAQRIELLQSELQEKNRLIEELQESLTKMKTVVHKILDENAQEINCQSTKSNFSYFDSYSHIGIHYDMLSDEVRTLSYKSAIIENKHIFHNKDVLDLGCGTGILSMFAASAGAKHVYAVDNSDIVTYTSDIIRENNLEETIQLIKARIEDGNMPFEKVDIIVSEWMGYFLLFEGMLDSLIYARDHHLKPNGFIVPDECNMFICGACDPVGHKNNVIFWSEVYGYSMSCIKRQMLKEAVVDFIPSDRIVTTVVKLASFNLYTCSAEDTNFDSIFQLICNEDAELTSLVGYFDTIFNLQHKVQFSTGPFTNGTHWKQTLFHIEDPLSVKKGEILACRLLCRPNSENTRSLMVTIWINGQSYDYNVQ